MDKLKALYKKYHTPILYIFYGCLTTMLNMVVYWLCHDLLGLENVLATLIAWITSVLFAFLTNKLRVFKTHTGKKTALLREFTAFVVARLLTGGLDLLIMYLSVDLAGQPGLLWKLISNVVVTILNYIISKLFVFKPTGK